MNPVRSQFCAVQCCVYRSVGLESALIEGYFVDRNVLEEGGLVLFENLPEILFALGFLDTPYGDVWHDIAVVRLKAKS